MKKYNIFALLMLLIAPLCFMACSEDEDTVEEFPDWKNRNEAYFDNIYEKAMGIEDGSWKIIRNYSLEDTIPAGYADHIVVEVLEEGTGSGCPMFTDSVLVHYRGRLLPSTSYSEGYVFDESYEGEFNPQTALPRQLYVGGLIDGFTSALQYMHIGDRWRVYIPYQLGYGSTGSTGIPAYSTLVFDIALVAYYRPGVTPDPWYAKKGKWITE